METEEVIDLLREEHDNIERVLEVMRKLSVKIMETGEVDFEAFADAIDVVRNYADDHHHGKEEDILFNKMSEELGTDVEEGPIEAMLSEHDLGRYFINNLETALDKVRQGDNKAKVDIIANAVAYADFLAGHIYKENNIIYSYAEVELSSEVMTEIAKEAGIIEKTAKEKEFQEDYLNLINRLEEQVADIDLS
ncbi:hemerythrin domain-containing protein [Halanaerocella petrolearia]